MRDLRCGGGGWLWVQEGGWSKALGHWHSESRTCVILPYVIRTDRVPVLQCTQTVRQTDTLPLPLPHSHKSGVGCWWGEAVSE